MADPGLCRAIDLEDRADHLKKVLNALSVYLTVILDDTAQNVPGGFDLRSIDALLCDLTSEVTGALRQRRRRFAQGVTDEHTVKECW